MYIFKGLILQIKSLWYNGLRQRKEGGRSVRGETECTCVEDVLLNGQTLGTVLFL